jgi:hypothetical protein
MQSKAAAPEELLSRWPLAISGLTLVEDWRLLKTCEGNVHLVGRFLPNGRFHASIALASLELSTHVVITRSGKRLQPHGEPGDPAVGKYIASLYGTFDGRLFAARDVTDEFVALMMLT